MPLRALGHRTDLIFHHHSGQIEDAGDCTVIRTPSNPTYRWGNMLLFHDAPAEVDVERCEARFVEVLGAGLGHRVFAWDIDPDDPLADLRPRLAPFAAAGYRIEPNENLAAGAGQLRPPSFPNAELEIRPLASDRDWHDTIELQVLCREEREEEVGYRDFRQRKMVGYRRMQEAGIGAWYGGWLGGELVADMGLFTAGDLGRYQHVETHPEYRRRGIAGTMVHALAQRAFTTLGVRTLVIAADPDGPAVALYKRLGFTLKEVTWGVDLSDVTTRSPTP
jgi:ribosomal protein S18 acetylase RimI-like enzyme